MSRNIVRAARMLAVFLVCIEAGPALAQAAARAADAAGGEREVVWYTAMNTPDAAPLRKRFLEKYPDLNLTILRQPGEKIRSRRRGCSPPTRPRKRAADFPEARSTRRAAGRRSTCANT